MSVNGVKIEAGQQWLTRRGTVVTIEPASRRGLAPGDTLNFPWSHDFSTVSEDGLSGLPGQKHQDDLVELWSQPKDASLPEPQPDPDSFPLIDDTSLETSEADAIHPFPEKHDIDAARFQTPGVYGTLTGMPFPKIDFLVQAAVEMDAAHMNDDGDKHVLDALMTATLDDLKDGLGEFAALPLDGPYGKLGAVLVRAFDQASAGKGKERHAVGETPFEDQPMATINKQLGSIDGFIYQAHKKSLEAKRLPDGRAQAELLGAINYLAGAVIALDSWAKKTD